MQRLSNSLATSISGLVSRTLSSSSSLVQEASPGDFLKWGLMGFVRTSRFATGFAPLEVKPLNSIMDVERARDKSPEDLASIWDDVMSNTLHLFFFFFPVI